MKKLLDHIPIDPLIQDRFTIHRLWSTGREKNT